MPTYNSALMGANFRPNEAKEIVRALQSGDVLTAEREPGNPYDPNAIMVRKDDAHLGYIGRGLAEELSPLIDNHGAALSLRVSGFLNPLKPYLAVELSYPE